MTCFVCPIGCTLSIKVSIDGKIKSVTRNQCKLGAKYAEEECTNPQRTITTTLRCEDGSMVAVKTETTIPKDKMFEAMQLINHTVVPLPVNVGDVFIKDVFGTNFVATQNR